ncbi:hypothetical protein YALI2_D00347g [Yarrowia lipolytica]|nr:hypothetical protein YALI2_D00347g [Yarrowia lipolytica]
MADELNNQFYYGDKAGVHFPPQNKEDFQELIDYHKKDLSIDQDILAVLNKKVQAQGGEPTEEQEEEIYYAHDRIELAQKSITYYKGMLDRLAKGLRVPV